MKEHPSSVLRVERGFCGLWRLVERGTTSRGIRRGHDQTIVYAGFKTPQDALMAKRKMALYILGR